MVHARPQNLNYYFSPSSTPFFVYSVYELFFYTTQSKFCWLVHGQTIARWCHHPHPWSRLHQPTLLHPGCGVVSHAKCTASANLYKINMPSFCIVWWDPVTYTCHRSTNYNCKGLETYELNTHTRGIFVHKEQLRESRRKYLTSKIDFFFCK